MNYGILKNLNHEGAKGTQILIRLLRLGGEILSSVELTLYNFKRMTITVKPNKEIFVFLSRHCMVKQAVFNGFTNVCFNYSMLKRRGLKDKLGIHRSKL